MSKKVVEQLNQIQADTFVLNAKFHNYHWNVKGLQFFGIHARTEEAYDELFEIFDAVAERAIQIGGKAIVCPQAMIDLAKAPKANKDSFNAKEVLEGMKEDYEYLLKEFKKLAELAEEAEDAGTAALAEEQEANFEKQIWMISQALA